MWIMDLKFVDTYTTPISANTGNPHYNTQGPIVPAEENPLPC